MLLEQTYHIYNHANGWENLFIEEKNYRFFLAKASQHLLPVCNIYAYCLMPNHIHLMVRIKNQQELVELWIPKTITNDVLKFYENKVSKCFSNLFSSYTQAFNKVYHRMGSLFIPSMKMELINDSDHFLKVVHYIHANPVHHRFTLKMEDWEHSSYNTYLNKAPTKISRDFVLNEFYGIKGFIKYHEQPIDLKINMLE